MVLRAHDGLSRVDKGVMSDNNSFVFLPLGGTGEIGMNCNLYGYGVKGKRDWLMVDLGVTFGRSDTPGVELITPDISYIAKQKDRLLGLVLTHGHEDHIGAVAHLWTELQCPIYATAFTASLVQGKLREMGIDDIAKIHIIEPNGSLSLGPFDMEFIGLTHSIAEMQAIAIKCGGKTYLHTGDWKIDPNPVIGQASNLDRLKELGDAGVEAVICDSTNVLSPGRSGSEADVADGLSAVIAEQKGRVIVTTFASNVARLASIGRAAKLNDRHVVLAGRGMHRIYNVARETGYLDDFPSPVSEEDAGYLPPEKLLILCTGSQGESRAALARLVNDQHQHLTADKGDTVIFSSKMIPGNEIEIMALQNQLARRGIRVIVARGTDIHVSGHPCRDELCDMYDLIRPKTVIPVHGEARHLVAHAELAKSLGVDHALVIENGMMVQLAPGGPSHIDTVPSGRMYLDGKILVSSKGASSDARRKLSHVGVVSVAMGVDATGRIQGAPKVSLSGLPERDRDGIKLSDWVLEAIELSIPDNGRITPERAIEAISQRIRRILSRQWGKKPVVHVQFVDL